MSKCEHDGAVRPVVWQIKDNGEQVPNTVVCGQCWKPISTDDTLYTSYVEGEGGWFNPAQKLHALIENPTPQAGEEP